MHRFFEPVIMPVLEELILIKGKIVITEVGIDALDNTLKIASKFQDKVLLNLIDPYPAKIPDEILKDFNNYKYYDDLSLNVLNKEITSSDVILLDGDHNYYTMYNELELINLFNKFPLIMMHDVNWPYARRDLYYHPENIPDENKHPHTLEGLNPENDMPIQFGGYNEGLWNSIDSGKPKMGVLTAIEDFVKKNDKLNFFQIPIWNGLGFVYEKNSAEEKVINKYKLNEISKLLMEKVEFDRVKFDYWLRNALHKINKT